MNRSINSPKEDDAPGYHALLSELKQLSVRGDKSERYQRLFYQLSKIMFVDFWHFCEPCVRSLNTSYYISLHDVNDLLQEVLFKIFEKIDSYSRNNDEQAKGWIFLIIRNTIIDSSRITKRRGKIWKHLVEWIRPLWYFYGEDDRSEND